MTRAPQTSRAVSVRILSLVLLFALFPSRAAFGQTTTTGDAAGVVQDQTNGAVPHAAVILKDNATGSLRGGKTNEQGEFHFTFLRPGSYEISATSPGLKSDLTEVNVAVGQIA